MQERNQIRLPFRVYSFSHSCISAFLHFCVSRVSLPLACTVRECAEPLHRRGQAYICTRGHSYDIARSGYVNLLQPQDRRSLSAGDSREAVTARAQLIAQGIGRAVIDAVVARSLSLPFEVSPPVAVELGSGSGETLGMLASARTITGVGIDLSTAAAAYASRHFPAVSWVVANADRRLPLLDGSVDLILSVHARRHPEECRRILRRRGLLLIAIPAADDLIELREAVQGNALERDRVASLVAEHDRHFSIVERATVRQRLRLDRPALVKLLRGTYRGERLSESPRVQTLDQLLVTLASDIVLFEPRQ